MKADLMHRLTSQRLMFKEVSEMSDNKSTENKSTIEKDNEEKRVGVFVCECGVNIGGVVNTKAVADYIGTLPGVKVTSVNKFTCSDSGQADIQAKIKEHHLNRVVVAAVSYTHLRAHET